MVGWLSKGVIWKLLKPRFNLSNEAVNVSLSRRYPSGAGGAGGAAMFYPRKQLYINGHCLPHGSLAPDRLGAKVLVRVVRCATSGLGMSGVCRRKAPYYGFGI